MGMLLIGRSQGVRGGKHGIGVHTHRFVWLEVHMLAFLHAMVGQHEMCIRDYACSRKTGGDTAHLASIKREYPPPAFRRAYQPRYAAAHASDAGHFGHAFAIETQRQVIGHLCRARTS